MVHDTACWTCKRPHGCSGQLKSHVDNERIKSESYLLMDQAPHQMFGQEHVVEWCELGFGFVQQVADQTANGSLEGLLDWVKVCVTNKSEVELHMSHGLLNHANAGSRGIDDRRDLSQDISWRKGLAGYMSSSFCPDDI